MVDSKDGSIVGTLEAIGDERILKRRPSADMGVDVAGGHARHPEPLGQCQVVDPGAPGHRHAELGPAVP